MNNNCMNIYLMMNMKYILVLLLQYPNQFFKTIQIVSAQFAIYNEYIVMAKFKDRPVVPLAH